MHDIKYFFSIKLIRQSEEGAKQFSRKEPITESITENHYFSKSRGNTMHPPLGRHINPGFDIDNKNLFYSFYVDSNFMH
jgi:hypothetical protein